MERAGRTDIDSGSSSAISNEGKGYKTHVGFGGFVVPLWPATAAIFPEPVGSQCLPAWEVFA